MNKLIKKLKIFGQKSLIFEILIIDGFAVKIGSNMDLPIEDVARTEVVDLTGCVASAGFVDMHVHLREPGQASKETVATGAAAAAVGGFTTIVCMPNTVPAIDNKDTVLYVDKKGRAAGLTRVLCAGALTKGQTGKELSDIAEMDEADTLSMSLTGHGICALSEDGKTLNDENLMREVCIQAAARNLVILDHAEPEEDIIKRDIALAKETGAKFHIQHVSRKGSVDLIREAKAEGVNITCETAPHYFALTKDVIPALGEWGALAKMNPPLGTEDDRGAIISGLIDGTIDVIATDHAPHELSLKALGFDEAPNGVSGLETAFSVSYETLVKGGYITLETLVHKLSTAPREILGLEFDEDSGLDLVIIDPNCEETIDKDSFVSMGKNTPFDGMKVSAGVVMTICGGKVTHSKL